MTDRSGAGARLPAPERSFYTLNAGRTPYRRALGLQETLLRERLETREDVLLLLEHPPVITWGRRTDPSHLLLPEAELERRGIERMEVSRGGDITYHGPGQLVGYPIVHLDAVGKDLHLYLRRLEEVLIAALATFGIAGEHRPGKTGVWVEESKIAAIGVGVRRWVAWHGFALNVGDDLAGFEAIVPCGLREAAVTSMERLLGYLPPRAQVRREVIRAFSAIFASRHAGEYEAPY